MSEENTVEYEGNLKTPASMEDVRELVAKAFDNAIADAESTARRMLQEIQQKNRETPPSIKPSAPEEQPVMRNAAQMEKRLSSMNMGRSSKPATIEPLMEPDNPASGGGGGSIDHMWKTEAAGGTEISPHNYAVAGGALTVQGTSVEVADVASLAGNATGKVYLKVVRDSASRAYQSHEIIWSVDAKTSIESEEFYLLAEVTAGAIRQHRFEEIISYEKMWAVNGSFKLLPFCALTRNTYDVPTP